MVTPHPVFAPLVAGAAVVEAVEAVEAAVSVLTAERETQAASAV